MPNSILRVALAMAYKAKGDYCNTIMCLKSVLQTEQNNSWLWGQLGDAYMAEKNSVEAEKAYHRVAECEASICP